MGVLSPLPTPIGLGSSGLVAVDSSDYDVRIGELEFMLAVGPDNPLIRRGAPYRAEQVNFSGEPGETALGFWWQREQSTWHNGAGNPTFDGPGSGDPDLATGRFYDSYGVDVWTPGQISLLPDTEKILATTSVVGPVVAVDPADPINGEQYVYWGEGDAVYQWSNGAAALFGTGAWGDLFTITTDGVNLYFTDGVDVYALRDAGATQIYASGLDPLADRYVIRWAKQRLMFAENNRLYELDPNAVGAALPSALYAHENPDWVWTDIAEGPGAIYASGYSGTTSAVYKFVIDTDGALPTLTAGIVACELPAGERALCLRTYIGLFIGVGTTRGLRVCSFSDTDIVLAPLTIENLGPIRGIATWNRFLYVTCDDAGEGYAGCARVDLSVETAPGRYAWAKDVRANDSAVDTEFTGVTGSVTGIVIYTQDPNGTTPVFAVEDNGVYGGHFTRFSPGGLLTSGRTLFGMTDPKHFLRISMTADGGDGTATILTGVDSHEATLPQSAIDVSQLNSIDLLMSGLQGSTLTIGVELTSGFGGYGTPIILSYSAKALPAQPREEQWIIPLSCYDRIERRNGMTDHSVAQEKLAALRELVRTQEPVLLQTFFGDTERDWTETLVHIEDFEYRQSQYSPKAAWGGVLTVSMRTITG